eukprot:8124544-Lingulodinium_polyedra.AAC.1
MASAWPVHGQCMANAWPVHGNTKQKNKSQNRKIIRETNRNRNLSNRNIATSQSGRPLRYKHRLD